MPRRFTPKARPAGASGSGRPGGPVVAGRPVGPPIRRSKKDVLGVDGVIVDVLPNTMFTVELENGHRVLTTLCGKMRTRYIRVTTGDRVGIELSPYDLNRGRITLRHR